VGEKLMRKRKEVEIPKTKFDRVPEVTVDGFTIVQGDLIKIKGEYGMRFKFTNFVTNSETGSEWIDCFEFHRGQTGCFRSFTVERIKRIPKKRGKRNVSRRTASTAS
jgi:hypothetical protein